MKAQEPVRMSSGLIYLGSDGPLNWDFDDTAGVVMVSSIDSGRAVVSDNIPDHIETSLKMAQAALKNGRVRAWHELTKSDFSN